MKKHLLFLLTILLPLCVQGKEVTETFEAYDYYDGCVKKASTFDGTGSFSFTSQKTYDKVLKVTVIAGFGDYLTNGEYSSGATITVNGQERELPITNTNTYRGSTYNLTLETYEFELNEENAQVTLEGYLGNGTGDFYFESVTVTYEETEDPNAVKYGLTVGGVEVTSTNRLDILGNGKVSFGGDNILRLTGTDISNGIKSTLDHLTIYLKGSCRIYGGLDQSVAIVGKGTLTITTEGNDPGSVYIQANSSTDPCIQGFTQVNMEQNLHAVSGGFDERSVQLSTVLDPLTTKSGGSRTWEVSTTPYSGVIAGDAYGNSLLYYALDEATDAYDSEKGVMMIGSTMAGVDVDEIISQYVGPCKPFLEQFHGLVFMVPAGKGTAYVDGYATGEGQLCVKIGSNPAQVFAVGETKNRQGFPYECEQATYVYVYNNSPVVEETMAYDDHRAGKKTTVTVGVGSVGVGASEVHDSNPDNGDTTPEPTGIKTITAVEQLVRHDNVWYTVGGRQLQGVPSQKGLYIHNGKKVVLK